MTKFSIFLLFGASFLGLMLDGLHENFSSVCEKKTKVISSSDGFRKKTLKDISKEDTKLRRTTEYKYLFLWVLPGV